MENVHVKSTGYIGIKNTPSSSVIWKHWRPDDLQSWEKHSHPRIPLLGQHSWALSRSSSSWQSWHNPSPLLGALTATVLPRPVEEWNLLSWTKEKEVIFHYDLWQHFILHLVIGFSVPPVRDLIFWVFVILGWIRSTGERRGYCVIRGIWPCSHPGFLNSSFPLSVSFRCTI